MKRLIFFLVVITTIISVSGQKSESLKDSKYSRLNCPSNPSNYHLKDSVPCPWTIIPFDVSHHGDSLKSFMYMVPVYDNNGPVIIAGNICGKIGDWFGIFYHDTCVAANLITSGTSFPTINIPKHLDPDSFNVKWYYSNNLFQTFGRSIYTNINHIQFEMGLLAYYPFCGFVPDTVYPIYVSSPNNFVYKHIYYYGDLENFPKDSTIVTIMKDTIISDSVVFGYYNTESHIYNPDTTDFVFHTKSVYRKVYLNFVNVDELNQNKIAISSNPATDQIEITGIENPIFEMYSVTGQCLMQGRGNTINVSSLPPGVYILEINKNIWKKILKI